MHDLLNDVALLVVGIECKVANFEEVDFDNRIHHLSFGYNLNSSWKIPGLLNLKCLRTFLLPVQEEDEPSFNESICHRLFSSYKRLQALDLHNLGVTSTLPSSIRKLIHLRYLNLSGTHIDALPDSVTALQNLQTLELNKCCNLERLPTNIGRLTNLRSLNVDECPLLTHMPSGMGALISLHSLPFLLVGYKNPPAARCKTSTAQLCDLKNLNQLKGSLKLVIHGVLKDPASDGKEARLSSKDGLVEFHIEGNDELLYKEVSGIKHDGAVLEGLKPHSNLKKLEISWYRGEKLPSWAVMDNLRINLPNLVEILLLGCGRCQQVPSSSQLHFLKCLSLARLESVEYVENDPCELLKSQEEIFFPSLQELTLVHMNNLKGWWKEAGELIADDTKISSVGLANFQHLFRKSFPNLSRLCILGCPNLNSMPCCPMVEDLMLLGVSGTLLVSMAANSAASTDMPFGFFSKLKALRISNVGDLISLPEECLSHISSLDIQDPKLMNTSRLEEVFTISKSLLSLELTHCHNLRSLSGGLEHLTALENLVIWNWKELDISSSEDIDDGMPWKALKSLRSLRFHVVPKLVALPSGLQHLMKLQSLFLTCNDNLETPPGWISCVRMP